MMSDNKYEDRLILRQTGVQLVMKDKSYEILRSDSEIKYAVGGLISEYLHIPFKKIRDAIVNIPNGDKRFGVDETDGMSSAANKYIFDFFQNELPFVQYQIMMAEFLRCMYIERERKEAVEEIEEFNRNCREDELYQKFVPEELLIDIECILQLKTFYIMQYYEMLKIYMMASMLIESVSRTYSKYGCYNPKDVKERKKEFIYKYFQEGSLTQEIDYKIKLIDDEFTPVYTLNDAMSLILFDFAQVYNNNIAFVKCKNCGKYFVPVGRSDSKYCSFPLVGDNSKTCKDVGAINTRAEKEKNDLITKEYRRVYMRLNMKLKRHPDSEMYQTQMKKLTADVKKMRASLESGDISEEDFIEWLSGF